MPPPMSYGPLLIEMPYAYESMGYYERWIYAITEALIRRGLLALDELGRRMAGVRQKGALIVLYRVRFDLASLWGTSGPVGDSVDVEIYENWLEPVDR